LQRAFLSPPNWLGFEPTDYFFLLVAALMVVWNRPRATAPFGRSGVTVLNLRRRWWCAGILFALPILLRIALLQRHPVPVPSGADDFGYLLLADTLRHFRLANPPHAWPDFFEQVFVLQGPTYSSMFNLGQGLVLALAWLVCGQPWVGVLLSSGALCVLTYWMLLGWTTREWSLAGGLLAVMLFGPLCYWTNCYWGGAPAACAGCLVFGAVARVRVRTSVAYAWVLGSGLALHLLIRPFESLFVIAGIFILLLRNSHKAQPADHKPRWSAPLCCAAGVPVALALVLIAVQNKQVTGKWTTLPYQEYRYQYGIPATFTFQHNAIPHKELNAEKQADYDEEVATHGFAPESPASFVRRLLSRVRFLRFFLYAPLYLALAVGAFRMPRIAAIILPFVLGSNLYPYFYPHYIAGAAGLFVLLAVAGLERLRQAGPAIVALCGFQFLCWYGAYAFSTPTNSTWNFVNGPDPEGRKSVAHQLEQAPGKHLVFVHYSSEHRFSEWVHNRADIDQSRVIYVHDIDPLANRELRNHYPDRDVWLLEPDAKPPNLHPLLLENTPFLNVP
jgi:hypothetical protein